MGNILSVRIHTEYVKLEQFLKLADIISSGGEAKAFLAENEIFVNGERENRR
ncbi:MAG: RNA-binding S4 domain-containing protein, partial [Erysipelotrichaceae bacterium]|nr:RNA-binding S4 domain-containing protein [Erysipelotrichaceae bacterium]